MSEYVGWQRDLAVSHQRLGDLATATGDLATARTAYQAALDITTQLAADPANVEWKGDLAISHERLGDVARTAGVPASPAPPTRPPWTSPPS